MKKFQDHEARCLMQIQYVPIEKREEFKAWAKDRKLSMRGLFELLVENKHKINNVLGEVE